MMIERCTKMILIFASILVPLVPAEAAEAWANNRKVTFLYPRDYGYVFQFDGATINPGSPCEANRVVILTQPNFDSMVATLISAFLNQLRIDVNYDDTTITTCETKVNRIIVRPN